MSECVKVMVRARPMNQREKDQNTKMCVAVDYKTNQVILNKPSDASEPHKAFAFDAVYDWNSNQRSVYDESAFPLVESVIEGYNGTIFAYGQTGCGKTHTMMGLKDDLSERGIIPNAFQHIFGYIDEGENQAKKFLVRCSYLEIYNEDVRDLLAKDVDKKLDLKEDPNKGVFVKDLTTCIVKNIAEIERLMTQGSGNRKTGETAMNKDSSRSHSIFTIYIETSEDDGSGEQRIKAGKLNLVDLAGSERQSKTQASGIRLKEATKINLSLSALGNVISALVDGKSQHIPYRDSKLTRLLQDSLGGNTKTVMIAAISPSDFNYDETLSTLRYASRAKAIKNKPIINEDPKDALLKQYEEEIKRLKQMLDNNPGMIIDTKGLGASFKRIPTQENVIMGGTDGEESVDVLLAKLAKKGKRIKILDESSSNGNLNDNNNGNEGDTFRESIIDEVDEDQEEGEERTQNARNTRMKTKSNLSIDRKGKQKQNRKSVMRQQQEDEENNEDQETMEEENQVAQREQLETLIKEMEQRLVMGGQELFDVQKDQAKQQRQLQLKLRNEKKRQKLLVEEKQKQEEEFILKEKKFGNMQEEIDENRKVIEQLRIKYKQANTEIKDLVYEHEVQKQDVLDNLRESEREIEFCHEVMKVMLRDHELQKIKGRAKYDDNNNRWKLPTFFIKEKEVILPKIKNTQALIDSELDKRDLVFDDDPQYHKVNDQKSKRNDQPYGDNSFNMGGRQSSEVRRSRGAALHDIHTGRTTPLDQINMQRFKKHHVSNDPYGMNTGSQEIDPKILNKKNIKSQNLHLQPLNHKTIVPSIAGNIDEIFKSQQLENHPLFTNQSQPPAMRRNQLDKLNYNPHIQSSGNMQLKGITGFEQNGGQLQMTFQATLNIEPQKRQLAPIIGGSISMNNGSPVPYGAKGTKDEPQLSKKQSLKKGRVLLKSLNSNQANQ